MSVSVNVACYFPFLPSDHNKTAGECPYWDPLKGCVPQRHKAGEHSHRNRFWCSSHLDYWLWLCHPSVRPHGHNHAGWGIFLTVLFPLADSNLFLRPTRFKLCLCVAVIFFCRNLSVRSAWVVPEWLVQGRTNDGVADWSGDVHDPSFIAAVWKQTWNYWKWAKYQWRSLLGWVEHGHRRIVHSQKTQTHAGTVIICPYAPLCPDCRRFLLRSLNKFPKARATLEELKHHPWLLWSRPEVPQSDSHCMLFLSQQKCPRKRNSWNVNKVFFYYSYNFVNYFQVIFE